MKQPTISMRDFFALPEIVAAQETQKRNPYGSKPHRDAHEIIAKLADKYGALHFIGKY